MVRARRRGVALARRPSGRCPSPKKVPCGIIEAMKARNLTDTDDLSCGCGSWLRHWRNHLSVEPPGGCAVVGCQGAAEVGAHVTVEPLDGPHILPFCKKHNAAPGELPIDNRYWPVSADATALGCALPNKGA